MGEAILNDAGECLSKMAHTASN